MNILKIHQLHTLHTLHTLKNLAFGLVALTVVGCAQIEQGAAQGPTGRSITPSTRESYLIPPEIPPTLIDYLLENKNPESEIVAIQVERGSENLWTLRISSEAPPNRSGSELRSFLRSGDTWSEV
ncbi:MAG: hypothetical protein FJW54_03440 [Actinobacteria bacterium]|nr:hypothetical protein [Actinomycetota bacterium]